MIEVNAHPDRQRLYIIADSVLSPEDFQYIIESLKLEAGKLDQGWVAAVDFRGIQVEDPYLNEQIELLQEALLKAGAHKIGTLLDNQYVRMRLIQAGMSTRSNEITQRFDDEQKWESYLAQP
jgi:hypothetical protein